MRKLKGALFLNDGSFSLTVITDVFADLASYQCLDRFQRRICGRKWHVSFLISGRNNVCNSKCVSPIMKSIYTLGRFPRLS